MFVKIGHCLYSSFSSKMSKDFSITSKITALMLSEANGMNAKTHKSEALNITLMTDRGVLIF